MTPTNKLISLIILGIVLFYAAIWWESYNSRYDSRFITLGKLAFHNSLDDGIEEAVNQSKPIFLYFRSETCFWCIVFEKEALSDERIIQMLDENFVLISIDTFRQKNVSLNLGVRTTPYMIFFTRDGQEISRIPGYIPKDEFLVKLEDVLKRPEINPES